MFSDSCDDCACVYSALRHRGSGAAARAYQCQPGKYDQAAAKINSWFGDDAGAYEWTENKIDCAATVGSCITTMCDCETVTAASCAACHMPATTYMVVDPRHDHSLRVPRPDLSLSLATPNVCNGCHTERDTASAVKVNVSGGSRHSCILPAESRHPSRGRPDLLTVLVARLVDLYVPLQASRAEQ